MLSKAGKPVAGIESSLSEACEREATRLYANVRWQGLTFNVAPMLGLAGTVYGVIVAFFATANMAQGANKMEGLATGIYAALICTLAGLVVAHSGRHVRPLLRGPDHEALRTTGRHCAHAPAAPGAAGGPRRRGAAEKVAGETPSPRSRHRRATNGITRCEPTATVPSQSQSRRRSKNRMAVRIRKGGE